MFYKFVRMKLKSTNKFLDALRNCKLSLGCLFLDLTLTTVAT